MATKTLDLSVFWGNPVCLLGIRFNSFLYSYCFMSLTFSKVYKQEKQSTVIVRQTFGMMVWHLQMVKWWRSIVNITRQNTFFETVEINRLIKLHEWGKKLITTRNLVNSDSVCFYPCKLSVMNVTWLLFVCCFRPARDYFPHKKIIIKWLIYIYA